MDFSTEFTGFYHKWFGFQYEIIEIFVYNLMIILKYINFIFTFLRFMSIDYINERFLKIKNLIFHGIFLTRFH